MTLAQELPPFSELTEQMTQANILVVGDVMLDRYWFGEVERISPEAPVPVARVQRTEARPGGAANVARNISALGGRATLLSVVGDDEAGRELTETLKQDGVTVSFQIDPSIATIVKLRVLARHQQLIRIDFEETPSHEVLASKLEEFSRILPQFEGVILSDYGKGGLHHVREMIRLAKAAGKWILVDPKGDDYTRYTGASVITPNRSELKQVSGAWKDEADLAVKVENLRQQLELEAFLLTRSEEGMSLFQADGVLHEPTQAQEVFDVSGAGDTVIATLGLMLGAGLSLPLAMRVANRAAGCVVAKLGTAVISQAELFEGLTS